MILLQGISIKRKIRNNACNIYFVKYLNFGESLMHSSYEIIGFILRERKLFQILVQVMAAQQW